MKDGSRHLACYDRQRITRKGTHFVDGLFVLILFSLFVWILVRVIRFVRKERYFASDQFQAHKAEIASFVSEHNEIAQP